MIGGAVQYKMKTQLSKSHVCSAPSFQFSSRWYLCARKSPHALHPVSQKFPQHCLWNGSNVRLTDDGSLSSFQGRSSSASSFHASLSPPGDRWCDALGFLSACSVSSSSTLSDRPDAKLLVSCADQMLRVCGVSIRRTRLSVSGWPRLALRQQLREQVNNERAE